MLSWAIQFTIISIILIFLVHHLINFFKSTLTVPKIKDLVNSPIQKYENIYQIISNPHLNTNTINNLNINNSLNIESNTNTNNNLNEYTLDELIPKTNPVSNNSMKDELKNFLRLCTNKDKDNSYFAFENREGVKKQINNSPIESLNIYESPSSFSAFSTFRKG